MHCSKPIILSAGFLLASAYTVMAPIQKVFAQTNTQVRKPAIPKAAVPAKRPPAAKPLPPSSSVQPSPAIGEFTTPEEDSWYDPDNIKEPDVGGPFKQQAGLVGVLGYLGSGAGAEYSYQLSNFTLGGNTFFSMNELKDFETGEQLSEHFKLQTFGLRVNGRYHVHRFVYAGMALGWNQISGSYGWKGSAITAGELETDFELGMPVAEFMIGSEFKGPYRSYFGVDWVGTSIPIGGEAKTEANADLEITSKALKGASPSQRIDDEVRAQLRVIYLNLRVGLRF